MKSKLSLKIVTATMLFFCAFFVMQSFAIKTEEVPVTEVESIEISSEMDEQIPEIGFCRYQLGGVIQGPNPPIVIPNQQIICIKCRQGGPNNLPCPSPFGSTYEILYQGTVVGTATNVVAVSRKCSPCRVGELTGITFRGL